MNNEAKIRKQAIDIIKRAIWRRATIFIWLSIDVVFFVIWNMLRLRYIISPSFSDQLPNYTLMTILDIDAFVINVWMILLIVHIAYGLLRSIYMFAIVRPQITEAIIQYQIAIIRIQHEASSDTEKNKHQYRLGDDGELIEPDESITHEPRSIETPIFSNSKSKT